MGFLTAAGKSHPYSCLAIIRSSVISSTFPALIKACRRESHWPVLMIAVMVISLNIGLCRQQMDRNQQLNVVQPNKLWAFGRGTIVVAQFARCRRSDVQILPGLKGFFFFFFTPQSERSRLHVTSFKVSFKFIICFFYKETAVPKICSGLLIFKFEYKMRRLLCITI